MKASTIFVHKRLLQSVISKISGTEIHGVFQITKQYLHMREDGDFMSYSWWSEEDSNCGSFHALVCCKPIKCNQKWLYCYLCNCWCHSCCSEVSDTQYAFLSVLGSATPWYCHICTLQQLPFADSSFVSETASSVSDVTYDKDDPLIDLDFS